MLGFDWHSSGVTTTTCGALKEAVRGREADFGFYVAGGKGAVSRRTPAEIAATCEALAREPAALVGASRLAAKLDNAALQDGHQLYHHCFVFTPSGRWCVVQQGMSDTNKTARRYHWLSETVQNFVEEPHAAICCDRHGASLDMVAAESAAARAAVTEIAAQPPETVLSLFERVPTPFMPRREPVSLTDVDPRQLHKALLKTYERAPERFDIVLATKGLGPKALRALVLTAELIYGTKASACDPASLDHSGEVGLDGRRLEPVGGNHGVCADRRRGAAVL